MPTEIMKLELIELITQSSKHTSIADQK